MKRLALALSLAALLIMPGSALAVHHVFIPVSECASDNTPVDPSNSAGMRQGLDHHFNLDPGGDLPLPPAGTPGSGQGLEHVECANAD
jgi:hypothetical protein